MLPVVTPPSALWTTLSLLGSPVVMTGLCVVLIVVLALQRQPRAATACALIAAGGGALDMVLKALVHRPRPPGSERFLHGHSWSFPSGHAMGSIIGYGLLCYVGTRYWSMTRTVSRLLCTTSGFLVLLIGISRITLGVHYRGDVAGGWAIGAAWLVGGLSVMRRLDKGADTNVLRPLTREP